MLVQIQLLPLKIENEARPKQPPFMGAKDYPLHYAIYCGKRTFYTPFYGRGRNLLPFF